METGSELFIGQFRGSDHAGWYSCIVEPLEEGVAHTVVSCPVEVQHARKYNKTATTAVGVYVYSIALIGAGGTD